MIILKTVNNILNKLDLEMACFKAKIQYVIQDLIKDKAFMDKIIIVIANYCLEVPFLIILQ